MIKTPSFYFWDDTAAAFMPIWRRIGDLLLQGQFPLLQLDMWRGGNFPAEAAAGIYNPVILVLSVLIQPVGNLAVAAWLFKVPFMALLAVGSFLLARDFGAHPRIAFLVGYAAPFTGFVLWSEASTWVAGLMILSFYPWVWLAARRLVDGRGGVIPLVVVSALCLTVGNPYAVFTIGVAFLAVMVEGWMSGVRVRLGYLVGAGVAVLLVEIPVLLPFYLSYSVGYRDPGAIFNDDFLRPGLTDLVAMSNPVYQPFMPYFGFPFMTYPGAYAAWFVVPLLAWIAWQRVPEILRGRASLVVSAAVWLLLVLAPSSFSFFRWPIRLLPYLLLSALLFWAVVFSSAFATDHPRRRWVATVVLVGFAAWLGFGEQPLGAVWLGIMALATVGASALLIRGRARGPRGVWVAFPLTAAILAGQLYHFPSNQNVTVYDFATNLEQIESDLGGQGLTLQIASAPVPSPEAYRDVVFGSMQSVAGRASPNAYSGIGYARMDEALCMLYNGQTCPELATSVFEPLPGGEHALIDYLGVQQVIVAKWTVSEFEPPQGWRVAREDEFVRVLSRQRSADPSTGTVTVVPPEVSMSSEGPDAHGSETISFSKGNQGAWITTQRLNWPGYRATIEGRPLILRDGPGGLLQVQLPEGVRQGDVRIEWHVPGAQASTVAVGIAFVLTMVLALGLRRTRRLSSADAAVEVAELPLR
jgi:hypothetical protein